MGEKGNITADELAAAASASAGAVGAVVADDAASASAQSRGIGAVIAGAGTSVTAVFEETGSSVRDKVIDKAADAGIATAQESWRARSHLSAEEEPDSESTERPV